MVVLFQVVDKLRNDFIRAAFKLEKVRTDTIVFRLHYKFSVWLVLLYAICYMYVAFSNPIQCMGGKYTKNGGISAFAQEVNDFCWSVGTFSVTNLEPDREVYPGIGVFTGTRQEIRYHLYYKWMYFYIASMIILLQTPRQVWRAIENGRMKALAQKMKGVMITRQDEALQMEKEALVDYLHKHLTYHRPYALGFVLSEVLNVGISTFLMFSWDMITENEFSNHGAHFGVMRMHAALRTDRLARIFPILGKCTVNTYGPGGDIQPRDFICVLPLNVMNERAAVFFWYYFMMLVIIGLAALVYRVILMRSSRLRLHLLCGIATLNSPDDMKVVIDNCTYEDWFVIYQIGLSLEPVLFREIMEMFVLKFPRV